MSDTQPDTVLTVDDILARKRLADFALECGQMLTDCDPRDMILLYDLALKGIEAAGSVSRRAALNCEPSGSLYQMAQSPSPSVEAVDVAGLVRELRDYALHATGTGTAVDECLRAAKALKRMDEDKDALVLETSDLCKQRGQLEAKCHALSLQVQTLEKALEKIASHADGRGCTWDAEIARAALGDG